MFNRMNSVNLCFYLIKMRAVCFVKRFEFDFSGNVFQNALVLGDVDNDGHNELVVGNANGDLSIYKYDRLWQKFSGLGMITAIAVGDVLNCKSNAIVVVSGDGWCHILASPSRRNSDEPSESRGSKLTSFHVQRIPANTKVALLEDIDADGNVELVLGLTDRVVRSYRWLSPKDDSAPRLLGLNKWECANQIGTITVHRTADDDAPRLFVAQPGGSYMEILCTSCNKGLDESISSEGYGLADSSVEYHPLCYSRMRNSNVTTEILGGIRSRVVRDDGKRESMFAVATLDGTLMLVNDQEVLWSMQVDHQLFAVRALDMTGDGCDEIVACAWNGHTYILDQRRQSVRFQLEEAVASFTAGPYTLHPGEGGQPTLVYTTFKNKIYVYHNVRLPSMVSVKFQPKSNLDESQKRQLTEWCLYGKR